MRTVISLLLLLAVPLHGQDSVPPVKVHYVVDATDAAAGNATVEMTIQNLFADEVTVAIPAWRPGSYRLLNYHQYVKEVTASQGGKARDVAVVDKQTWKVAGLGKKDVTVKYKLKPPAKAPYSNISREHYFVDGPGTYFYIVDRKEATCTVRFKLPEGWKAGSGLRDLGDGIFGERDYDTFVDCPTELGPFELFTFKEGKATYDCVVHATGKWDSKGLLSVLPKIVREQCAIFGGPPYERYVFIFHFRGGGVDGGGGGLEHLNSTHIALPIGAMSGNGAIAAGLCSHEFFHLWNVKRIRPKELGPFDYSGPVRSKALWMCEGVTSYYGDLTLPRAKIWSERQYFQHIAHEVEVLQNNPRRKVDSVEAMSQQVWDSRPTDYYNYGEVIGWVLDMKIRAATSGAKSLDDVMRHLYETYVVEPSKNGKGPIGVGYPDDGVLKAIQAVSGQDFSEFFKKHISGTEEMPFEEAAAGMGLSLNVQSVTTLELKSTLLGLMVINVPAGSADEKAGLKPRDVILEVAGTRVTETTVARELQKLAADKPAAFKVRRDKEEMELKLTPAARERILVKLNRAEGATPEQSKWVDAWLGQKDY